MALVIGLVLGIAAAALRDASDRRFRSSDEIVAELHLPVLGVVRRIPRMYHNAGRVEIESPAAAAAYGVARAGLEMGSGNASHGRSTITVTSTARGEGRTAVAVNLAASMAQVQKRVLLIDANFHSASLHEIFGIQNESGLSSVLGGNEPVDDLISPTGIHRLDILPAGPTPANPAAALGGERMNELLRELSRRYDRIVIDAPQVGDLPDARLLAATTDATVLVVRADRSSRAQAARAVNALENIGAYLAGVVVHDAPAQSDEEAACGWCCCGTGRADSAHGTGSMSFGEQRVPPVAAA
jgi:capsular exopolysaccharide synthesis family protein